MSAPAAIKAAFSDMKLVKTRQVAQLIFEIPLADFDAAYHVLGVPNPANERWFGIAAVNFPQTEKESKPTSVSPKATASLETEKPRRDWRDVQPAAQAGIRCAEPMFRAFLREVKKYGHCDEQDAAVAVRDICGVASRVELGTKHAARVLWHQLDTEYQAWLACERVGA